MSNTVSGSNNSAVGSANLNQAAAHDTSLYDPAIHDNQIVALFNTDDEANAAKQVLVQSGFSAAAIQVMARDFETDAEVDYDETTHSGFWGAIRSLFVPDEDRNTFNHAIAHGHSMLVVTPDSSMDRQHLVHVIESTHPLDFDAKLEEWRQAGYDSSSAMTRATTGGNTNPTPAQREASVADSIGGGVATGFVGAGAPNTPASTAPRSETAEEAAQRIGRRDMGVNTPRVRSYITDRPDGGTGYVSEPSRSVEGRATPEPLPSTTGSSSNPNATPGATTSGMNSPRP